MHRDASEIYFSYAPADDRPVAGSASRFGFASLIRLNLVQSFARRGIAVAVRTPDSHRNERPRAEAGADRTPVFSAMLRGLRLGAGLSQEALAERARISVNGLSALERGARRTPRSETLALLVEALGLAGTERSEFERAAALTRSTPVPASDANEPFDVTLADALVIVLTRAWLELDSCRAHLERFTSREGRPAHRILVVRREPDGESLAIEPLARRPHFDFFRDASHDRPAQLYYRNDGRPVAAFYDVVDALTESIFRQTILGRNDAEHSPDGTQAAVFVAAPTGDMEVPYRKLVAELASSGYRVVPPPALIAGDLDDVEPSLASALCSIHLLGDEDAFDDAGRSRVSFPLSRAAVRARTDPAFRRIVFAPRFLLDAAGSAPAARDPIDVHERYAETVARDAVFGDSITDFILGAKELIRAAERTVPSAPETTALASGSTVFINFHPGDVRYARDVANALRERGLRARFAAFEDDKIANRIANDGLARQSHAVVHCWATASDAWLYAEAATFEDWRKIGRSAPFRVRAAVAGPPEGGSKLLYSARYPPEAIDVYVDLTKSETPVAADLDPIVSNLNAPPP